MKRIFSVIDHETGKEADIEKLKKEPWAEIFSPGTIFFAIDQRGILYLLGLSGEFICLAFLTTRSGEERFKVMIESENEMMRC